jgi:hypothetical protein
VSDDTQRAAELQVLLEGVALPATRQELVDYALRQDDGAAFRPDLERLPDREYRAIDEVGEELVRVQPAASSSPPLPREESGQPPGGDAYTDPNAEPGAVRHDAPPDNPPQKAIDQQTQTQETQKQRQEQGG